MEVGDTLRVRTPTDRTAVYTVRGEVEGTLDLLGNMVVDESRFEPLFGSSQPSTALVRLDPGADPSEVQDNIAAAVERRFPTV